MKFDQRSFGLYFIACPDALIAVFSLQVYSSNPLFCNTHTDQFMNILIQYHNCQMPFVADPRFYEGWGRWGVMGKC